MRQAVLRICVSVAVPASVTAEPSRTSRSAPAFTVGAVLTLSVMVIMMLSETVMMPSETVRVNSTAVSPETLGTVKDGVSVESSSDMDKVESCDHEYVRLSSWSASVAVPASVTAEPSRTSRSAPAFTVGAVLTLSVMVIMMLSETVMMPSETVRVNSTAVSPETLGTVKDGVSVESSSDMDKVESCDHTCVRPSSGSVSVAVPASVTAEPSRTSRSAPAFTVGAVLTLSVMVIMMLSETVMMPSETVRVNSTAVSPETLGTVKDGVSTVSSSDMDKVESCDHEYVRLSSWSASVAVPARVTVSPSATSWSVPAFTVGAVLTLSVMVIMMLSETVMMPSETVRVNSTAVSPETLGTVKDGVSVESSSDMDKVESCDHTCVRPSSGSVSVAVPASVTAEPSRTSRSAPAFTVGAVLTLSVMVIMMLSETVMMPSETVRVNSTAVSPETLGTVKDGASVESSSDMDKVESCDHTCVRPSSGSVSVAVPASVTAEPSRTSRSAPAFTVGAVLTLSVMVIMMLSETVMMPSETVRVNSTAVSPETLGTVKDGVSVESSSDMDKVESCDHTCVRPSSGSVSVAVPASVTAEPSVTSWSVPAFTVGAVLTLSVMVIMMLSETVMMPSETVRVNSTAVSPETLGTVKDGVSVESSSDMDKVESCDHTCVRPSSGSVSVAVPASVTAEPSRTSRSAPAFTVGAVLTLSVMVIMMLSETVMMPSETVRVNSTAVSPETLGTVKDGVSVESSSDMDKVESCDHTYVRPSSGSASSVAVPARVTVSPSVTSWSVPAFTVGAVLTLSVMVIMMLSETVMMPSETVRVNSTAVSPETLGTVKDGVSVESSSDMDKVESCDHTCVRPSSGSASVAVPASVTAEPSRTSRSAPAFTVGAVLTLSVMVIMMLSETVMMPSETVRVNSTAVSPETLGTVKDGVSVESSSDMDKVESCDHTCTSGRPPDPHPWQCLQVYGIAFENFSVSSGVHCWSRVNAVGDGNYDAV